MGLLSVCQAPLMTSNSIMIETTGLSGLALPPEKALATLLVSGYVRGDRAAGHRRVEFLVGDEFAVFRRLPTLQGWERFNLLAVPLLIVIGALLLWLRLRRRTPAGLRLHPQNRVKSVTYWQSGPLKFALPLFFNEILKLRRDGHAIKCRHCCTCHAGV